ncbi:oncoprotein-induced transcript 3 protein-like isoform X2 [Carcharodon carcharias]|uniref:oncoprotein-induced transcript 3 protein-like isoform X2 n=1 Tax=Carcharodon carcharias TaxID=13397 RepID=UPI001B7EC383|nr:oncoprotein-induced transcript 3 protein-like isoform X2 [Carcharodon carcharias]
MWTLLLILGFLNSGLTDPCVDHTILDQVWRSVNCIWPVCSWQWKCDGNLQGGWYRFKSSGGWKITDSVVSVFYCSTYSPGWLQGSHPTLGQGVVTRTVCFTSLWNPCYWTREIKVKNCSRYFVYELKPAPGCSAAYCTDPRTTPTPESEVHSAKTSSVPATSSPTTSELADSGKTPALKPEVLSTRESPFPASSRPAGSAITDPETSHKEGSEEQCSRETARKPSFVRVGSSDSVVLDLSNVDCDQISAEVQVMYVGKNKLDTGEEKEAHLRQVHETLKNYLPCKKLVPKVQQDPDEENE